MSLFSEVGIILAIAAIAGLVGYFLKQPLVLAYMLAGVVIGPYGLKLVTDTDFIHMVGDLGIMLMLFLVGIEMNVEKVRNLGKVAITVGIAQIFFTGLAGWLVAIGFGYSMITSVYIAIALALSSTAICVKILSDQKTLSSLYGKMVIGILLVQDLVAVLVLMFLNTLGQQGSQSNFIVDFGLLLGKGAVLTMVIFIILKRPLARIYHQIAHSQELLILVSLSWCFGIALIAELIGFSREIGAFLAGLSLANLPYALEVSAKSRILRDFFITTFFVMLGAGMVFANMDQILLPFIALSLFVLIGNPLIVLVIMRLFGFDVRSSFFAGITIAQISEFSFILVTLGFKLGHLNQETVSLISMVAIFTISLSSYMMKYQQQLYRLSQPFLHLLPKLTKTERAKDAMPALFDHIILLGCGSGGHQLLDTLVHGNKKFVIVDHDPDVIEELSAKGINCLFGDVQDEEVFTALNVLKADLIISLLPHVEDNLALLTLIKESNVSKKPIYIAAVNNGREGFTLFSKGADYVIVKSSLEANHIKQIHADLYHLEHEYIAQQEQDERVAIRKLEHTMLADKEYAQIVHELSKLRLKEISLNRKSA